MRLLGRGSGEAAGCCAHRPRLDRPAQRPVGWGWELGGEIRPNTSLKREGKERLQHLLPLHGPSCDPMLWPGFGPYAEEPARVRADISRCMVPNLRFVENALGKDIKHTLWDKSEKWGCCAKRPWFPWGKSWIWQTGE